MNSYRKSQGIQKVMSVTIPVILTVNILTGITVICLMTLRSPGQIPLPKGAEIYKQKLEQMYLNMHDDLHLAFTRTHKQERATPSLEFLSLLKPVFHQSGLYFDRPNTAKTDRRSSIRNWALSAGSDRSLMYNGMTYKNGSIIVPASGSYFVYSHVKFYVEDNTRNGKQNAFYHSIFRYNAMKEIEEVLLSNHVTECKEGINDGAHLEYPSDIRGVVHLNAGDEIIVKVTNSASLKHDRDWHCFGAYLI